ncbi:MULTISPECIES: hypothetical protein [Enterobacter]|uniref:tail fiber/spike domain-containing protein n=1 Tax=Enterobacter TaxID=547 RepID=UPI00079B622E|nr:hypothetical protein [Enterobacter hormaechei]MCU2621445.1 hypothetical protein [Enterobacter hormaechei subsp. hoffmannii]SAF60448.1 T7 tail fiber protein [Enterobacter hormaechei]VAF11707.1 T7 tail fiber protein [Enterobacter hormaechei]VAG19148.1 T7 tail fiber protein [Enterobacter hormaechei]VAG45515.1 T7 tail fiber protein [Enterobacter hormaechei]
MATTPTQNSVPSESPRDLKFNAGKIDEFVTSLVNTYVDRFGNEHYTIEGLRWLAQQAIAQYGWIPVGTFQAGATLTLPNQILKDTTDGEYYRWDGSFLPSGKFVPNGSTPGTTGGVGVGAWISVGDSTLRALLASVNGATQIGTSHRGLLSSDLNAIDRRPSGYGDSVSAVLANGQDVEIEKTYLLSSPILPADFQVIDGKGGSLTMNAVARAVHSEFKKGFTLRNLRIVGNIVNGPSTGNVAYGVQLEDSENFKILGLDAKQFSGSMELLRCTDFVVRDVYARNMRYHDNVAAGGYGVLLGGSSRGLIDGINFRASAEDGDLGRHAFYISLDASGNICEDIIIKNIVARYADIDNRNMPAGVIRRSNRCMIDGFNVAGSNGGFGLNAQNGVIQDLQIRNGHMKIIQYDDNAVYGISGGVDGQPNTVVGLRVDNYTFEGEVKSGVTPASVRLHALAVTCRDSYFTNTRIKSHGSANPILVASGAFNVTFDGIKDFVSAGNASGAALIRFMGSNSNIKVFNIDTARAPFVGLDNVTDLTVNWERFARIVSANGTVTTTDTESLISTVSATGTGELTVSFKPHVTADAVRKCTVTPASVAGLVILPEISSKNLILRFYNGSGVLVPLGSSIVSADIRLHS